MRFTEAAHAARRLARSARPALAHAPRLCRRRLRGLQSTTSPAGCAPTSIRRVRFSCAAPASPPGAASPPSPSTASASPAMSTSRPARSARTSAACRCGRPGRFPGGRVLRAWRGRHPRRPRVHPRRTPRAGARRRPRLPDGRLIRGPAVGVGGELARTARQGPATSLGKLSPSNRKKGPARAKAVARRSLPLIRRDRRPGPLTSRRASGASVRSPSGNSPGPGCAGSSP